jgi:hypothetical protein
LLSFIAVLICLQRERVGMSYRPEVAPHTVASRAVA